MNIGQSTTIICITMIFCSALITWSMRGPDGAAVTALEERNQSVIAVVGNKVFKCDYTGCNELEQFDILLPSIN